MYYNTWLDQRRNIRLKDALQVHYDLPSEKKYADTLTADISEGGIKMHSDRYIPKLSRIALKLRLASNKSIELTGQVKWSQRYSHSYRYLTGIEFTGIAQGIRRDLQKHIAQHSF